MSLYGALNIGISGLNAASQALSVTSSNIANVNTVGYKEATSSFATFLDSSLGSSASAAAGVTTNIGQNVAASGLATTTTSATDLSISGNGFFAVTPQEANTSDTEYTQVGSFAPDSSGNLVNANGQYLLGWQLGPAAPCPPIPTH